MKTLSKILIGTAAVSLMVAIVGFFFWNEIEDSGDLSDGYDYIWGREENIHISKAGQIIVPPAIIDIEKHIPFFIGLRLNAKNVICDNGKGRNILLENSRWYFILNTQTGDKYEYQNKAKFQEKLSSLSLKKHVNLDYSLFDEVWERYSKIYEKDIGYYSSCVSE